MLRAGLRGKRLRLSDDDRRRLAVKAQALGREVLAEIAFVATPARLLRWYRYSSCPKTQTNSRLARRAVSIVIAPWRAPDLERVGGDVGDSGSPYAQGKQRPATGCHAPGWRPESRPWAAPGPERARRLRHGSPGLDSGLLGWPLFRRCTARSVPVLLLGANVALRKSRLETNPKNEALSALLARLWCHLPLQNPANRAENLTRLCSATICKTGWRMVKSRAIRCAFYLFIRQPHGSEVSSAARNTLDSARIPRASKLLICGLFQKGRVLAQDGMTKRCFRNQVLVAAA